MPKPAYYYQKRCVQKQRRLVMALLGKRCKRCGFDDEHALQLDHVAGGGGRELRTLGSYGLYKKVLSCRGEGYQILCANCNWIKRHENSEKRNGSFVRMASSEGGLLMLTPQQSEEKRRTLLARIERLKVWIEKCKDKCLVTQTSKAIAEMSKLEGEFINLFGRLPTV